MDTSKTSVPGDQCTQFLAKEVLFVTNSDQTVHGLDAVRPASRVVGHVDDLLQYMQGWKDERPP